VDAPLPGAKNNSEGLIDMRVKLTAEEISYLLRKRFLPENLLELILNVEKSNPVTSILDITNDQADEFRDAFGSRLAIVGFDKNYMLTPEGQILESLIDRFFVGN
jgi:hypothetical protein